MGLIRRVVLLAALGSLLTVAAAPGALPAGAEDGSTAGVHAAPAVPPSPTAQKVYQTTREKLMQVRTLLKDQDSQASVGSGFIVTPAGHVITNYHVVSQFALQPQRYRLTFAMTGGASGALELLAFDAIHDLALLRMVPPSGRPAALTPLAFRPLSTALANGERIYSLGNPLDLGFAVIEGNYNGLVARNFYPQIFFAGALSAGMSGGPALDAAGQVIGINVSTRLDGQEVSFLVPAEFAEALLLRGRDLPPITTDSYPELTRQLMAHQTRLVDRFLAQPWRNAGDPRYRIPVPQEEFMRCWGSSSSAESKGLEFQVTNCRMDSAIFISNLLRTGNLDLRHEVDDGHRIGALRFAHDYSARFGTGQVGHGPATTAPECRERFVDRGGLPLRAVVCLAAYRKLIGLFDLTVRVATVDDGERGVQGQLTAHGLAFDNALRLTDHYLQGYGWNASH